MLRYITVWLYSRKEVYKMARLESTSLSVSPSKEQEAIETYQKFGWELKSSQEIFSKDSHNEVRGDSLYSVTETTNYVKLVFQRDKDMPYYNEICEIEKKFFEALNREPSYSYSKAPLIIGIIIAVIGAFVLLSGDLTEKLIGLPITALGILIIVWRVKTKNKKEAEYDENYKKWNNECTMLLAEVENYI